MLLELRISITYRLARGLIILAATSSIVAASTPLAIAATPEAQAQQALLDLGYAIGAVDGKWGPKSKAALQDYQRKHGLLPTGLPDPGTLATFGHATSSSNAQPTPAVITPLPPVPTSSEAPAQRQVKQIAAPPASTASGRAVTQDRTARAQQLAPRQASVAPKPSATETPIIAASPTNNGWSWVAGLGIVLLVLAAALYAIVKLVKRIASKLGKKRAAPTLRSRRTPSPIAEIRVTPSYGGSTKTRVVSLTTSAGKPAKSDAIWFAEQDGFTLGSRRFARGMVYVGEHLQPQSGYGRDNCLIVPSLPVAKQADSAGQYLDYWPSYERLAPSSRRAYLDWLASDRADPQTNIGYVFLYFYGLERRLLLDRAMDDREAILVEIHRLQTIYGGNRSFARYSSELLDAIAISSGQADLHVNLGIGAGDVPSGLKVAIGRLAANSQPIPPSHLLAFAASHPETRLRTPARRLSHLLEQRFSQQVAADFPKGLVVPLPKNCPRLELTYRAASGTFQVPLVAEHAGLPDLGRLVEPLGYARKLIEQISTELDAYSREIGRQGSTVTLATLGKLPPELRPAEASELTGDPLSKLQALADSHQMVSVEELLEICGIAQRDAARTNLKELGRCLGDWGLGVAPDPSFAPRSLTAPDAVLVFRFDIREAIPEVPSPNYQLAYLTLALGMLVAKADGIVTDDERKLLGKVVVTSPDLSNNERRRLLGDLRWFEASSYALADLRKSLKELPQPLQDAAVDLLLEVAHGDGSLAAAEVALLERAASSLGLDKKALYDRLNRTPVQLPKPQPAPDARTPTSGVRIDRERLATVRLRTAGSAALLAGIFADDEPEPVVVQSEIDGVLDERHRALVHELCTRAQWSKEDFDRFARQADVLPGRLLNVINEWSLANYDELLLEGDDPIVINSVILEAV